MRDAEPRFRVLEIQTPGLQSVREADPRLRVLEMQSPGLEG